MSPSDAPTLKEVIRRAKLSAAVVKISELENTHRFDAEYYQPHFLTQDRKIERLNPTPLSRLATVSDGNHMTIEDQFTDSGIRYLRGQDLGDFFISDTNAVYIPKEVYASLVRSHMKRGDVLLSIVGTIGSVGLVTDKYSELTGSCKLAIIRPKNVNSHFLATYLSSSVGQAQIARRVRGAVQQGLILPDLRELSIPSVSDQLIERVKLLVTQSQQKQSESEVLYAQAQALLSAELGLDKLDLPEAGIATRRLSDVQNTDRIDAEYYQAKYTQIAKTIKQTPFVQLNAVAVKISNGKTPAKDEYADKGVPILKVEGLKSNGFVEPSEAYVSSEWAIENTKGTVQKGDCLVLCAAHHPRYIGKTGLVMDDFGGLTRAVGELIILRYNREVLPTYMCTYLNLSPVRLLMQRMVRGNTAHLYPDDLGVLPVPILPMKTQQQFDEMFRSAHESIQVAKRLLAEAKAAVERLIESG